MNAVKKSLFPKYPQKHIIKKILKARDLCKHYIIKTKEEERDFEYQVCKKSATDVCWGLGSFVLTVFSTKGIVDEMNDESYANGFLYLCGSLIGFAFTKYFLKSGFDVINKYKTKVKLIKKYLFDIRHDEPINLSDCTLNKNTQVFLRIIPMPKILRDNEEVFLFFDLLKPSSDNIILHNHDNIKKLNKYLDYGYPLNEKLQQDIIKCLDNDIQKLIFDKNDIHLNNILVDQFVGIDSLSDYLQSVVVQDHHPLERKKIVSLKPGIGIDGVFGLLQGLNVLEKAFSNDDKLNVVSYSILNSFIKFVDI